jgi:hypothetical protein
VQPQKRAVSSQQSVAHKIQQSSGTVKSLATFNHILSVGVSKKGEGPILEIKDFDASESSCGSQEKLKSPS